MTDSDAAVAIQPDDDFDEVLTRLREGGAGGQAMTLVIPASSSLFLTATEFRALKSSVDRGRFSVTIRTSDTLRLQLARMLGIDAAPLETRPAPRPASTGTTKPPQQVAAAPPAPVAPPPVEPPLPPASPPDKATPSDVEAAVGIEPTPPGEPAVTTGDDSEAVTRQDASNAPPVADEMAPESASTNETSPVDHGSDTDHRGTAWPEPPIHSARVPSKRAGLNPIHELTSHWSRFRTARRPAVATPADADAATAAEATENDDDENVTSTAGPQTGGTPWQRLRQAPPFGKMQELSPRSPPVLAAAAIVIVLIVVAGRFFLIPRADITITLAREPVRAELIYDVTSGEADPSGDATVAVAAMSESVAVVYEGEMPTTGTRSIPDETASSELLLRNATAAPITVEPGTLVRTEEGVEFAFDDEVTVPGVDPATGDVGAASAIVTAVEPGTVGNVETGAIGGQLSSGVYYSNREGPARGGSDRLVAVVAPDDIEALATKAEVEMLDIAESAFAEELDGDLVAIPASLSVAPGPNRYSHEAGEDAEILRIETSREVTALTYDPDVALREANRALRDQLSAATPDGYVLDRSSITVAEPELVTEREDGVQLRLAAKGIARAELDDDERRSLASRLAGLDDDEAVAILGEVSEIEAFEVEYQPAWFRNSMPGNDDRITVHES